MTSWSWQLELTRPWWLLALAALPVLAYYHRRSLVDFPSWQRRLSLALRAMIILLLAFGLAGANLVRPTHEQFVVFAIDRSLSVGADATEKVAKYLADAASQRGPHQLAYLLFERQPQALKTDPPQLHRVAAAGSGATTDPPSAIPAVTATAPGTPAAGTPAPGTNLAAAIETAAGAVPPTNVPHLVLLTDGNETEGDAIQAAVRAGMPISVVPLATRSEPEIQVSAVRVPAQVREGEPFVVEVVVDSNHDDEAQLTVFRGAHQVARERKALKAGENRFRFEQSITGERLAEFTARIDEAKQDTLVDNNAERGLVFTAGKPRVLIIESDPKLIRELVAALEQEDIAADVRPPQGMPDSLSDLQNYELLILSNVPATDLTQRQMELARTFVQDLGGGCMMLGGEESFGLGGYYKTAIEEVLPVRSDFEKEKEKPSLGMVLVIDKSGSMGGEKIEMAKSAARSAVELLGPRDQIAVVAFDGETYLVSELQPASNKSRVSDDISRIDAGGGTTMYPAMERALELLRPASAKLKHVILLTDGVSSPGDFLGLAQQMIGERITVSAVAIGDADEQLLKDIAHVGQGRFHATSDPANIPQIFAKETVTASKSAIDEQPFVPQVVRATQALADLDMSAAPFLLGHVMTRPKPTSEVILTTENGDPLLVWWRYGLGMSTAFTSDAKSRWGAEWLTWPGYGKFWAQVVRQTMRRQDAKGIQVGVATRSGRATVTLDAVDDSGRFVNQAETGLTVIDPRLAAHKILMRQVAPGQYVGEFETPLPGAYHLDLTQSRNGKLLNRQTRGVTVGYSDELRIRPTNEALLRQLAAATGGLYDPTPSAVLAPTDRTARQPTELWTWLLGAATALLLLDVLARRIDLSVLFPVRSA